MPLIFALCWQLNPFLNFLVTRLIFIPQFSKLICLPTKHPNFAAQLQQFIVLLVRKRFGIACRREPVGKTFVVGLHLRELLCQRRVVRAQFFLRLMLQIKRTARAMSTATMNPALKFFMAVPDYAPTGPKTARKIGI